MVSNVMSTTQSASAAEVNGRVRITNIFVELDPNNSRYVIKLQGELSNNSSSSLTNTQIVLGTENQIVSKYALDKFYENRDNANLTETDISAKIKRVAPNSKSNWQITFFADDVLTFSNGLYGLGVNAYAPEKFSSDVVAIPLFTAAPTNVMATSFAVQISTLNYHLANGGSAASDLRELNRLTNLILSARDLEITWLVDPAIYQWLAELSNSQFSEEAALLSTLINEISGRIIPSLYSQPDVSRMLASDRDEDLGNLIVRTQQLSGSTNIVLVPANGQMSRDAVKTLGSLGVKPVISNDWLTGDEFSSVDASVVSGETVSLVRDDSVLKCLRNNSDSVAQFQNRNCLLSTLTLISIEQVKNLAVITPINWSPAENELRNLYFELTGKTWLSIYPFTPLLSMQPTETFENVRDLSVEPFSLDLLETGDSISTISAKTSSMFLDANYSDAFSLARLRGYSSLWSTGDLATEFLLSNESLLTSYQDKISVEASKNIMVSNSTTEIPITVVNGSDRDVSITVQLVSPQESRFESVPSEVIAVPSGKRVTVPIEITLTDKGIFNVTAALYAPNGQPVGKTKLIQISSAEYQGLARTLVLIAFGLLILLSISNIVKRRQQNSGKS